MSRKREKTRKKDDAEPADAPNGEEVDELQAFKAERDDLLARLQRLGADYQNYQKRVQRDIAQAREYANEDLIKSLLGVLDDMERALDAARENHGEDDPLFQGMHLVHDKALQTLGALGLSVIEAVGKPFDPERHAAMMQQPDDDHPPQTVLQELQRGYLLKDRTLRPAAVIVSREPDEGDESQATEGDDSSV